jgi:hypothetical protein
VSGDAAAQPVPRGISHERDEDIGRALAGSVRIESLALLRRPFFRIKRWNARLFPDQSDVGTPGGNDVWDSSRKAIRCVGFDLDAKRVDSAGVHRERTDTVHDVN